MRQCIFLFIILLGLSNCKTNHKIDSGSANTVIVTDSTSTDESIVENPTITFDTLKVSTMDTISIELMAQFSTGKLWVITENDEGIKLIDEGDSIKMIDGDKKDFQNFHFSVYKKGVFNVQFTNKRPFGEEVGETKVRNQTIIVE